MPHAKQLPDIEILNELILYSSETGRFTWKERGERWFKSSNNMNSWNTRHSGRSTGGRVSSSGYRTICILGVHYLAHRVAYLMANNIHPNDGMDIDHIDGDRLNNSSSNLRVATRSQNNHNMTGTKGSATGVRCVTKHGDKYRAKLKINRRSIEVGVFTSVEEAATAVENAMKIHYKEFSNARIYAR